MDDNSAYHYDPLDDAAPRAPRVPGEPASRWRRLWAKLIDGLIAVAVTFGVSFALTGKAVAGTGTRQADFSDGAIGYFLQSAAIEWEGIGVTLLAAAILMAIQAYFLYSRSQSIGKMALSIVICRDDDGSRAGFGQILLRRELLVYLITLVPVLGSLFSLVDSLFIFGSERRCLHDLIAGTRVLQAG